MNETPTLIPLPPLPDEPMPALLDEVSAWLMAQALGEADIDALVGGTCQRLYAAGLPLLRMHVAFNVLHPLYSGMGVTWRREKLKRKGKSPTLPRRA